MWTGRVTPVDYGWVVAIRTQCLLGHSNLCLRYKNWCITSVYTLSTCMRHTLLKIFWWESNEVHISFLFHTILAYYQIRRTSKLSISSVHGVIELLDSSIKQPQLATDQLKCHTVTNSLWVSREVFADSIVLAVSGYLVKIIYGIRGKQINTGVPDTYRHELAYVGYRTVMGEVHIYRAIVIQKQVKCTIHQ